MWQKKKNLNDPDHFFTDHKHRKDIALNTLQKSSETITGLSIKQNDNKKMSLTDPLDTESNDGVDKNQINFLKLVTFKKKDDRRSFLKTLNEMEKEKKNIKMDDVMEDLTHEVKNRYKQIKLQSDNHIYANQIQEALLNAIPSKTNEKNIPRNVNHHPKHHQTYKNNNEDKKKKVIKFEGEDAIELDICED